MGSAGHHGVGSKSLHPGGFGGGFVYGLTANNVAANKRSSRNTMP